LRGRLAAVIIGGVATDEGGLELRIPQGLIEALADQVAEIVIERLDRGGGPPPTRWMRSNDAAAYLGWSKGALYDRVSRRALPHYKVDGILLFNREELDAWLDQYKQEPRAPETVDIPPPRNRRRPRRVTPSVELLPIKGERPKKERKRPDRPLPAPLGGDAKQKAHWARELEISRAELDEMSPRDFNSAWEARNERLRVGGVFDHLTELTDAHGWDVVDKMTASELIKAVADLGLAEPTPRP
jgi:excisionase family DNA binding protein